MNVRFCPRSGTACLVRLTIAAMIVTFTAAADAKPPAPGELPAQKIDDPELAEFR